jgi:sugar phosphate isomerase/epimerase
MVPAAAVAAGTRFPISLGFSLYGMQTLPTVDALRACAEIGFNAVELMIYPGSKAEPELQSVSGRLELQKLFCKIPIALAALGEDLELVVDDVTHRQNIERIKRAGGLFQDLYPFWKRKSSGRPRMPIVVLTLGGKSEEWPVVKDRMVERLHDWAVAGAANGILLAIKAHVGSALHTPQDARWLKQQVGSPWVKFAYDYSHFLAQGIDMKESMRVMLSDTVFIHAKDSEVQAGKVRFLLPGQGKVNYLEYMKELQASGYRGAIVVEVSSQIHRQPGYDPISAARQSYAALSSAFAQMGISAG